mgnify:CR=1 FL=1
MAFASNWDVHRRFNGTKLDIHRSFRLPYLLYFRMGWCFNNTNIIKQLSEESDKKMQHMMQEFRETMQSMMQNFMQHISTMLTNLLPTIIQSITNNTQRNITVQHPPPHPTPPLTNLNTSTPFQNTQKFKPHTKDPPTQYKIHGVPQSTGSPQIPV